MASVVTTTMYLFEKTMGTVKPAIQYFIWGMIILGSLYTHKIYCEEVFDIGNNVVDRSTFSQDFKFVPKGVPSSHVNEDGTPSLEAVRLIKATSRANAYRGLNHHANKTQEHEDALYNLCWYLPEATTCEKAKLAFTGADGWSCRSHRRPWSSFRGCLFCLSYTSRASIYK
jgi:hypothetical protein